MCKQASICFLDSTSSHLYCVPAATKIEWESPLKVLRYPNPRLRATNLRIGVFDSSLRQLAEEMFEVMYQ